MTAPLLTIGITLRRCGHPRTEENTYRHTELLRDGRSRERDRCKECSLKRSQRQYAQTKNPITKPTDKAFCGYCLVGNCKGYHALPDHRCLRLVTNTEDAHVCACGSAFARAWRRFLELERKWESKPKKRVAGGSIIVTESL